MFLKNRFIERRAVKPPVFSLIPGSVMLLVVILLSCKNPATNFEEDLETDGVDRAMRQEFLMTRDPALNVVPKERILQALDYLKTFRTTQAANLTWQERGPKNVGGRTRSFIIDKRDPSGNTVFAGSVSGGIFKTTNFLSSPPTWTPVNDQLANLAINAMVQDPTNPNIMYAGTGEGWFNYDAVKGAGIFKSIDGGTTWTQLPSTATTFDYVNDLVIDKNGNLFATVRNIFASSARGIQRSIDGGATWTQVAGAPLIDPQTGQSYVSGRGADLEVASNGDIYATLGLGPGVAGLPDPIRTIVLKSTFWINGANTGAANTWVEITPAHSQRTYRGEIAVAPSDSSRVYLLMQDSATDQVSSIYRSIDGGTSWSSFPAPAGINNGSNSQTWFDLIAAVDPNNPDVIVAGGLHLVKSTNGGSSFSTISSSGALHVDQHMLIFESSSNLVIGNDGGIFYSSNINTNTPAYSNKNNGYSVIQFYGCDYHPTNENYFLAGAQDNNTQRFTDPGINTTTVAVGGDGGIPHIDQTDGMIQIASLFGNQFWRSTDGGANFSPLSTVSNSRGRFISPSDYDDDLNVLYASDDEGSYYCIKNLTGTPSSLSNALAPLTSDHQVSAVKVDPTSSATIWLAASVGENATNNVAPKILKVSNANTANPTILVNTALPISVPAGAYISSIDVDPADGNRILVTLSNYGVVSVWLSTNGGTSWSNIEGNLPDMPINWGLFAPQGAQLGGAIGGGIILGTELGVWTTSEINGTSTAWIPNNSGLPNVRTDMVKYSPVNTSLVAATHGRGLFTAPLVGVITGVSNNVITKDFIKYISADANQLLVVKGGLNTLKTHVQIYDATGKLLYNKEHPYQNLSIPINGWSRGSYILKIQGNNKENFVRQFIKR